jgi:hypothetical protein
MFYIDDFFEDVYLYEEIEFWDDFEDLMMFDYETLVKNEELYNELSEFNNIIDNFNKKLLFKYSIEFNKAHINVLYNMIDNIEAKKLALLNINNESEKVYEKIHEMKLELIELARQELYLIELKKLPIFD